MHKEQDKKVDTFEQAAEQLARLFVAQIEELNSLKNKNYESENKK